MENYMKLEIAALSENESFARNAVAAFALSLNPSLSEISDIKTAVSEAVTNSIVHAYKKQENNRKIDIECSIEREQTGGVIHIKISDYGCGIEDVEKAVLPFFTRSAPCERPHLLIASGANSRGSRPFFFASSQRRYNQKARCSSCARMACNKPFLYLGSFFTLLLLIMLSSFRFIPYR